MCGLSVASNLHMIFFIQILNQECNSTSSKITYFCFKTLIKISLSGLILALKNIEFICIYLKFQKWI